MLIKIFDFLYKHLFFIINRIKSNLCAPKNIPTRVVRAAAIENIGKNTLGGGTALPPPLIENLPPNLTT